MQSKLFLLMIHVLFGFILCSGLAMGEWGAKGSFSPLAMTADNGKPLKLTWTYLVNQGKPLVFNTNVEGIDVNLKLQFSNLILSIDSKTLKREAKVSAKVTGTANGQIRLKVTEDLQPYTEGKTLITSQQLDLNGGLSAQGVGVSVTANILSLLSPASEWFLDRNDLDLLPVGTLYNEQGVVTADISGNVCVKIYGQKQCEGLYVPSISSPDSWEITGHSEHIQAGKTTYSNIVEVNRNTLVPALNGLLGDGGVNTEPANITYWVAKGVGMVKGYGQYRFLGQTLLIELKSTTITIPKITKVKPVNTRAGRILQISGNGFGKTMGKVLVGGAEINILSWKNSTIQTVFPVVMNPGVYDVIIKRDNEIESASMQINLPN